MKGYEVLVHGPLGWTVYAIDGEVIRFRTFEDAAAEIREALPVGKPAVVRDIETGNTFAA